MRIQHPLLRLFAGLAAALSLGAGRAQDKAPQPAFPFPTLPITIPFIPLAPQPGAVPLDSEGWRAVIDEYGPPLKGRQAKVVEDVVAELSRGAGYVAPRGGYRSTLLDTSTVNAFAIRDGNVFVTRQLLAYLNNEDELVGVLGHEVGHVIGGHPLYGGVTHAAQRGSDMLVGLFLPPIRGATFLGTSVFVQGFSRAQEHAADVAGVKFLADLGRDPNAMGRALDVLEADSKLREKIFGARPPGAFDYWLNDHPIHSERTTMTQMAANVAPRAKPAAHRTPAEFVRELDGMVFEDGPEQGIVDGSKFRHPILKFGLDAPASFKLLNGSSALLLRGPSGSSGTLKMTAGSGSAAERFKAAWTKSFPDSIAPPAADVGQIGGLPSASGSVEKRADDGSVIRISMWLYVWSDTQSFLYAALDPKGDNASQHTLVAQSFRRLSDAEAAAVPLRRLRVADIAPGDTVASLSRKMAYGDFQEDRFRLINGLFNGQPLPKSGVVKLVVWTPQ